MASWRCVRATRRSTLAAAWAACMTQTTVLIRDARGSGRRRALTVQHLFDPDHAAAAVVGRRDRRHRGQERPSSPERETPICWWCTVALVWPGPVVDRAGHGCGAVRTQGVEFEKAGSAGLQPREGSGWGVILDTISRELGRTPADGRRSPANRGVAKRTRRTGYQMMKRMLLFPAINVNDSVTKSKFEHLRLPPLAAGRSPATDVMLGGVAVVMATAKSEGMRAGARGKGCRVSPDRPIARCSAMKLESHARPWSRRGHLHHRDGQPEYHHRGTRRG